MHSANAHAQPAPTAPAPETHAIQAVPIVSAPAGETQSPEQAIQITPSAAAHAAKAE